MFCAAPAACSLRSFPSLAATQPKTFLVLPVYCLSISGLICLLLHTVFLSPCTLTAACLFVCLPLLPLAPSPLRGLSCSEYGGDTSGASLYYLPANPVSLRISVSDSSLHLSLRLPLALRLWPLQAISSFPRLWEPAIPQSLLPRCLCPQCSDSWWLLCLSQYRGLSVFLCYFPALPVALPSSRYQASSQSHIMFRSNLGSVVCSPAHLYQQPYLDALAFEFSSPLRVVP